MDARQTLLFAEAAEAACVAERQLAGLREPLRTLGERLRALDPPLVLTCARGSSDHAATFAKYLIETRALTPVASFAPSVASLHGVRLRKLDGALFLAISQSGRSPDLIASARVAREAGALVVALVNEPDSPLAQAAEIAIPLLAGPERCVAATKSFIASLLALLRLVACWTEDAELEEALSGAPDMLRRAWALDWTPAVSALQRADHLYVLGRGLTLAIAQEAALKLKETCALHAEAFSAAEARHGPLALVGPGFPVLMLTPAGRGGEEFRPLAAELAGRGATVLLAGQEQPGAIALPTLSGLHPAASPLAMTLAVYRVAARLAVARGLDPDRPPHLVKVTETR